MISTDEKMTIDFKQNFSSSRYAKAFVSELESLGIPSKCSRCIEFTTFEDKLLKDLIIHGNQLLLLFVRRSKKSEYIISKFLVGFIVAAVMILVWLVGAVIGGSISLLSFDLGTAGVDGLIMCIISKILLMGFFVSIFVLMSVIAKDKLWKSIIGSLMIGMLFFMMIPVLTPLDSEITNVLMCLIGGIIFSIVIGIVSNKVLGSTDLV